jgi:hypothetical protein
VINIKEKRLYLKINFIKDSKLVKINTNKKSALLKTKKGDFTPQIISQINKKLLLKIC